MGDRNIAGYASKSSRQDFMQALAEETRALAVTHEKGTLLGPVNQHDLVLVDTHLPDRYLGEPG